MKIGEIMTPNVISVTEDTPLREVAQVLDRHRVSGLPVVDGDEHIIGVVSEYDLIAKPNAFILGISALSVWGGTPQWGEDLKKRIRTVAKADIPVSIACDAVVEALKRHGVKKKIAVMAAATMAPRTNVLRVWVRNAMRQPSVVCHRP